MVKVKESVVKIPPYVAGKQPPSNVKKKLKLSSNENLFGYSKLVDLKLKEAMDRIPFNVYYDAHQTELKHELVNFLNNKGFNINNNNVVFGDGSGEVLKLIMELFLNTENKLIIPEKSFILYSMLPAIFESKVIETKRNDDFSINLNNILECIDKNTKLIILANPDNPTGLFIQDKDIESFVKQVPSHVAVLIDEAYIHFAGIDKSALKLIHKFDNLIVMHTFSKAFGLAGLRVGYGIMSKRLTEEAEKIRLPFNLGMLQQIGAKYALQDSDFLEFTIVNTVAEREFVSSRLKEMGYTVWNSEANFVFADFGKRAEKITNYLYENGVSLRRLENFGFEKRYVRITVGPHSDMEYFLNLIGNI